MFLPLIINYALKIYGIDLEKLINKYPILKGSESEEEIKDTSFVDRVINKTNSGILLKAQLDLLDLNYVYIRKMLHSSIAYYEVIFDTYLKRSISYSMIKDLIFYKSFVFHNSELDKKTFTPPIAIDNFNGNIPSNAIIVKLDLAGKYYSRLKEDYQWYKKYKGLLKEFTITDFQANGFSDLNLKWYKDRQEQGNTKVEYWKTTYNVSTGNLTIYYKVTPTYIGIPNPHKNNEIATSVTIISKAGEERKGKFYTFWIQFQGIGELIGNKVEWQGLSKKERIELVRDIIDSNDVKLFDNTMAYKWQGTWKILNDLDATIFPFPNFPDKNEWNGSKKHNGIHLDKHYKGIFETLKVNADKISQSITDEFDKRSEI